MKKLLIATTALVATAGIAAAEVAVTGDGRMGVVYGDFTGSGDSTLNFSSRARVDFTLSGETDGGLSFGGWFRVHEAGQAAAGYRGSVFISGAFGKLEMGDTVGAAEAVVGDFPEIGFSDLSTASSISGFGDNDIVFITGDQILTAANNPVVLYTYTAGSLTFALSFNDGKLGQTSADDTQEYAVGVKYAFGDYAVSLGYEVADPVAGASDKHLILGGEATFGTTTVKAIYGDGSGGLSGFKHYGVGVTSVFDALTVKGYVYKQDFGGGADVTQYGLGAEYDLGGGAALAGGVVDNNAAGQKPVADFGIKFTF